METLKSEDMLILKTNTVNKNGRMISNIRIPKQLPEVGLIEASEETHRNLQDSIKDGFFNIEKGEI